MLSSSYRVISREEDVEESSGNDRLIGARRDVNRFDALRIDEVAAPWEEDGKYTVEVFRSLPTSTSVVALETFSDENTRARPQDQPEKNARPRSVEVIEQVWFARIPCRKHTEVSIVFGLVYVGKDC